MFLRAVVTLAAVALLLALLPGVSAAQSTGEGLTGEFVGVPATHDGSKFTFELRFSPEPEISYTVFYTSALSITGGSLAAVSRIRAPRNDRWRITIEPYRAAAGESYVGDLVVTLGPTESCNDPNAICTNNGDALSTAVTATVAGPPPEPPSTHDPDPETVLVWSGALEVAEDTVRDLEVDGRKYATAGTALGYSSFTSLGSLPGASLEVGGLYNEVLFVVWMPSSQRLYLGTLNPLSSDVEFEVNDAHFAVADSAVFVLGASWSYVWDAPDLGWTVGDSVDVRLLAEPPRVPAVSIEGRTGFPTVLVASAVNLTEGDGSPDASVEYQWIGVRGSTESAIADGTGQQYTADLADGYDAYKVRISYTDDAGTQQTLVSTTTDIRQHVVSYGVRLPDLVSTAPYDARRQRVSAGRVRLLPVDGTQNAPLNSQPMLLLRFNSSLANIGFGPVDVTGNPQLADPADATSHDAWQRTLTADRQWVKLTRPPIRYETADGHSHFHLMDLAEYSLWDEAGETRLQTAAKVGFCLIDTSRFVQGLAGYRGKRYDQGCRRATPDATELRMGISAGLQDVYGYRMAFQWVDISDVPPGRYRLAGQADPNDLIWESDETNNGLALSAELQTVPGYVAVPQTVVTPSGAPVEVTLDADTYGRPNGRGFRVVEAPGNGTLDVETMVTLSAATVTYTPDDGFEGGDSFVFEAFDVHSDFPRTPVRATVTIHVGPPDDETPEEDAPDNETSDNTPDNETPDNNTPDNETPDNTPDNETPDNTPDDGTPDGTPDNTPDDGTPDNNTPDNETPDDETPDDGTPDDETPDDETPDDETPDDETPDDGTPDNTPDNETPDDETPDGGNIALPAPLTATLDRVPETHDGSTEFTLQLLLSEQFSLSYVTVRDAVFDVTGGTVVTAYRIDRSSNRGWNIRIRPSGSDDVRIVVPGGGSCSSTGALCTSDGRSLSTPLEAVVRGPG